MILHLSPDAPFALRALADATLWAHIGGGVVGIAAGYAAVLAKKGARLHRAAGDVFSAAMLVAYGVGCVVSPLIHQPTNAFGGAFGVYLVITGWATVRRPERWGVRFEMGAAAVMAATAAVLAAYALVGARKPSLLVGVPWQVPMAVAGLCLLAAALDLRVALQGGVAGPARLRRHLWRMCFAFFFGAASLFLGQPKVFPPALRGSAPLILLAVAPLLFMAFWLIRMRSPRRPRRPAGPAHAQEALS